MSPDPRWVRASWAKQGSRTIGPGQLPSGPPENGTWFKYEGHFYMYDNGKWFSETGNQAWIPVWFTTSPFEFLNEGVFSAEQSGKPWPAWGTNTQAADPADNPIALTEHVEQMRGVLVMCYMATNTTVSIPILDRDLDAGGSLIYGDALLGPCIPPMVCFRHNAGGNQTTDIVTTPGSTTARWSDIGVGSRGIPASDDRQFSVSLSLAKDPQPHWLLNVAYAKQGANETTTFACWLVGIGTPISNATQSWEHGTATVPGHYKIYLPFDIANSGRQNFLTDGVGGLTDTRRKFMSRTLYWGQEYVGPANDPTSTVDGQVYLTDSAATGGTNVFPATYPPCVWVFGDDELDQDRGTTVTSFRMSSWGIGFEVDGYLNEDTDPPLGTGGQSIQTPSADEYCSYSWVDYGAAEWRVRIWNRCNTNNINGNARAPASGTGNRHYVVVAFGIDAAPNSAAAGNRYWSKQVAGTTMDTQVLRERALKVARMNVLGGYGALWWTEDGTASGDDLFGTDAPPGIVVLASDPKQPQTFTIDGHYGPMLRPDVTGSDGQFMWLTSRSGSKWVTEFFMGGLASAGHSTQGDNANRQLVVYAIGASA